MSEKLEEQPDEYKSRSQSKREAHAVTELVRTWVNLKPHDIRRLGLPEELLEKVLMANDVSAFIARKRHIQYISKYIRKANIETSRFMQEQENPDSTADRELTRGVELLRDGVLSDGDAGIQRVMEAYPEANRQELRAWQRQHLKLLKQEKLSKIGREIFKYLKTLKSE